MGGAHLLGHVNSMRDMQQPADEASRALYAAMRAYTVHDVPFDRTVMSLYLGFSLTYTAMCLLIAGLVLVAAKALNDHPAGLRTFARMYLAGLFTFTVISMQYFIWPPTVFLLVALGLAAFGVARLRKPVTPPPAE